MAGKAGTYNVGAPGIIMMSQAIRRAGRIPLPVPASDCGQWIRWCAQLATLNSIVSSLTT